MARSGYRVLHWYADVDGPWSAVALERYRDQGCDGLVLVPGPEWTPPDLSFVLDVPGLRYLALERRFRDDTHAFLVESLEELSLVTGSSRAVPEVVQPNLVRLCLTNRPGISAARWPNLEEFRLGGWRDADLGVLAGAGKLRVLHVEGKNQSASLHGIEGSSLEVLEVLDAGLPDLGPLAGMSSLRELKLMGSRKNTHSVLDVSVLASAPLVKVWMSNAAGVTGLSDLAQNPALREVRLINCGVGEAEVRGALPQRVRVTVR
ncbi:hypothetical protein [Saccharothrix sp.]|uniref:hypothetical protein n=1 Tax=Saccharothrix sp. TaxID=1873460 RepID=UPI002811ED91|nr:hypothetical protein [Saccharothrix sp.]